MLYYHIKDLYSYINKLYHCSNNSKAFTWYEEKYPLIGFR
ncbi:hypothetical protein PP427_gp031 [Salmonella phage KM16]|nr:hypothetical protein PP427_gp031 [Salmonella phage KM16]